MKRNYIIHRPGLGHYASTHHGHICFSVLIEAHFFETIEEAEKELEKIIQEDESDMCLFHIKTVYIKKLKP